MSKLSAALQWLIDASCIAVLVAVALGIVIVVYPGW
jgi:hypothetical protein